MSEKEHDRLKKLDRAQDATEDGPEPIWETLEAVKPRGRQMDSQLAEYFEREDTPTAKSPVGLAMQRLLELKPDRELDEARTEAIRKPFRGTAAQAGRKPSKEQMSRMQKGRQKARTARRIPGFAHLQGTETTQGVPERHAALPHRAGAMRGLETVQKTPLLGEAQVIDSWRAKSGRKGVQERTVF